MLSAKWPFCFSLSVLTHSPLASWNVSEVYAEFILAVFTTSCLSLSKAVLIKQFRSKLIWFEWSVNFDDNNYTSI